MGLHPLVVALALGAPPAVDAMPAWAVIGQTKPREILALPPLTEKVKVQVGLKAWKVLTKELAKASKKLELSTQLQKEQHDFLIGPAREQANDCGVTPECLAEIGSTLGANLVVAGKVTPEQVELMVIEVSPPKTIATAQSAAVLAKKGIETKTKSAIRILVALLEKKLKGEGVAAVAAAETPPITDKPPRTATPKPADTTGKGSTTAASPTELKLSDDPVPAGASDGVKESGSASDVKVDSGDSAAPPPATMSGRILIDKSQLGGVTAVSVDGAPQSFQGDGSLLWEGPAGSHTISATRVDGARASKDVLVDPGTTTRTTLEFAAVAAVTKPEPAEEKKGESVTGKWWFWTTVGAAVAAGTTTAILLAGGEKGGPSLPASTGSIRGTY